MLTLDSFIVYNFQRGKRVKQSPRLQGHILRPVVFLLVLVFVREVKYEMVQGKVKWFSNKKGYGFIEADNGEEVFVHYSDITSDGFKTLNEGEQVEFELEDAQKGKKAVKVKKI